MFRRCFGALPTTSLNGITGTWAPALNNTTTTTYTFTPTAGQCATTTTLTITVNPNVLPTFNPVAAICSGGALAALPTTSLNGITGTWAPALNNTATTTYTFTPTVGQCATTTTLTITVNPNVLPTFNPVAAICSGGVLAALPTTSLNGITGTWAPALNNTTTTTYTFTPTAGQCATTTTLTITVNPNILPTFNPVAAICSGGALAALPTTSLNGITGTWAPALNNTTTTTYTFTPTAGQCATTTTLTITVNPNVLPTFNPIAAICSGDALAGLPTTSLNGITGTWAPALNNTATTTYTFTPTAGQCATTTTLTITVNPNVLPTFNPIAAICSGDALAGLPTTSLNGIAGTWAPALNNTATTTYTFTPTAGQCATTTTLTITVNPNVLPTFNPVAAICSGDALAALPTTSVNGITGTWTPALNNTTTTTYTFTPTAGQCATTTTLTITVNAAITPTFNPVAAICSSTALAPLPTTSINGITGTWSPALSNTATTTYTFTPTAGQCATTTTLVITVNPRPTAPIVSIVQPTCTTPSGTTIITSSTTGLTYSLDGGPFNIYPGGGYTGLTPGAHTLVAQNASGCISVTTAFTINAVPVGPSAINSTSSNATCGNNNGSITLGVVTGGTAPFTYSFDGSAFTGTINYINLVAGNHTVVVSDANGCTYTSTVVVNNATGATVIATSTNSTCGNPNGSITATGTGGTTPYQYSIDGVNFQAAAIFTGVSSGTYTITIKDANGCINTTTATVLNTAGATVTAISANSSCGNSNGSITATGVGGTAPYQYSIDGTTFQASNVFAGLAAGTYTITIRDASNCTSTTSLTITNSTGATVSTTSSNSTCGNNNGSITATGNGGTAPYQYSIDGTNFQASNNFAGLAAGTYTVSIKDANGCINTTSVTIANTTGASITIAGTNSTCGSNNGSITATGTGGTAPYQYSIDGTTYQASNIFTALAAGSYTIYIKDANNCVQSTTILLTNIAGATVTAVAASSTCGAANGSITATGTGGTAPYQYSINGITFQAGNVFAGLNAGNYTITIKDANNCINTVAVTVNNIAGATVSATTTNGTCGNANGTITATGNGGTAPYQYSIDGINFQAAANFTGLSAGTYTITIKDANNCINTSSVIVSNSNGATVTASSTNSTCGNNNGSITANGTGGLSPYQYSIDGINFQASAVFNALSAGNYTITIKDANNCISTVSVTVSNTSGAIVAAISTNASCGVNNGSITATGTGGTTPYQYSIDGTTFQASNNFTALAAGTYTITIKDANNCTSTTIVTIVNTNGATITGTSTNTTCNGNTGTITLTGAGGLTPYQFSIDGINFQAGNNFTGLAAGNYIATIKDANNCTNTVSIIVLTTTGATVTATPTNSSCDIANGIIIATGTGGASPYQYSIDGINFQNSNSFTGLSAGSYTISIKDANGCINTTTATIINIPGATVTATSTNSHCGNGDGSITATGNGGTSPYQYSIDGTNFQNTNSFTGLNAGSYTVTIKDANGCLHTTTVIVANTAGATVSGTSTNSTCGNANGTITATGTGGTAPYQYSIDGTNFQPGANFNSLIAGNYTITIKDANNCTSTFDVIVNNTPGATVTATSTSSSCGNANGTITATGLGGSSPYQYSIDGTTFQASPNFTGLAAGTYTISIKDANNCINTTTVIVTNSNGATVTASNTSSTCGNANGTITATGTGGTTPYQYSIDGINFQSSNVFNGLAAGNYTVTIKDANNCTNGIAVTITNIAGASVTATNNNSTCGNNNGTITATGTGGTAPYQYSIDGINYQASNNFTGLAAGTYTLSIKDASNCTSSISITITNSNGATVSATSTNSNCGNNNGSIAATGTGGTSPYQFSIDGTNFQASGNFNNLAAGTYTVTIKDANGCSLSTSVIITDTPGATVTATASNSTCGNNNGSISATGNGGTAPYTYSIDGTNFQISNTFNTLAAGTYTITIKDANGCQQTTSAIVANTGGATVSATATNSNCGGTDGSITATGTGGAAPYQYSIDGTTYQASGIFTSLTAGNYTISIKDANNCINTTTEYIQWFASWILYHNNKRCQ
ncbi:MAG: hypothetical protein IPP79_09405 [Chitinophagaceae bacterium]|nr:hypothetical protein [Chitinophagaceae bacterium]